MNLNCSAVVIAGATIAGLLMTPGISSASDALATRYGCNGCHLPDKKLVGPSFKQIATRYADKTGAQLGVSIKGGSSGKWGGPIAMPPQPSMSEADASALGDWVLSKK